MDSMRDKNPLCPWLFWLVGNLLEAREGVNWPRGKFGGGVGQLCWEKRHPLSFTALKGDRGFAAGHWVLCGLLLGQAHPLYTEPPWKGLWGRPTAGSVAAVPGASQLFKHPWKRLNHSEDHC